MEESFNMVDDQATGSTDTTYGVINNDVSADIAVEKIKDIRVIKDRLSSIYVQKLQNMQEQYQTETQKLTKQEDVLTENLKDYYKTLPSSSFKSSKVSKSYRLLSGTLRLKSQAPEFVVDQEKLRNYLQENNKEFIEEKLSTKWGEFKKTLIVVGDTVIDSSNQKIVEGVTINTREDKFIIE